jgi:hypothetical protein
MTKALALLIGLALAGAAQAQIKCWTDAKGKRACGDVPPPGVRLETPRGAPAPKAPAPKQSAPAADARKQVAPAPVPRSEAKNRARQVDPNSAAGKAAQAAAAKAYLNRPRDHGDAQDCSRAQEMLRKMGGGGRSQRTDAVKARAMAERNCS